MNSRLRLFFCIIYVRQSHPVEVVTPGQIAAIYQGDLLLGGGVIEEVHRLERRID